YPYVDEEGKTLFVVERLFPKSFRQKRPDGAGGWINNRKDVRPVLYRLPQVLAAVASGDTVYVVEGEKDVAALERLGLTATTNVGGAGKWRDEYSEVLRGADVVVVADRDKVGREHAQDVARSLAGVARSVKLVEATEGKDAHDHVVSFGLGAEQFVPVAEGPSSPSDLTATVQPPTLAYEARILDRIKSDVGRCGVVGEDRLAATVYLSITSRLLDKPVSCAVKGTSSTGKSRTVETVTKFFPPDAILAMTAMSERALVYMRESFKHRTLVLYEAVALREGAENDMTSYFVRSLLSEGRLSYPVTVRDKDGSWTTKTIEKEGPTNIILTTTSTRLHGENETRLLSMTTNDTQEQTRRVLRQLAADEASEVDLGQWRALQEWLESAEHRVVIPYAAALAEAIPPVAVRLRRDFGAVLSLLKAHAVLHQLTRERDVDGRIVASDDDYLVVRELVADLISEGVGATVPATIRETVSCVEELAAANGEGVKVADVAKVLRLDKSAASRRLSAARDRGFVVNLEERRGRPSRYAIGDPMPGEVELLPSVLEQRCGAPALEPAAPTGGCTVARESEGDRARGPLKGAQLVDPHVAALDLLTKELSAEIVVPSVDFKRGRQAELERLAGVAPTKVDEGRRSETSEPA
ncbi:MAG: toprim domain-containing protein, partial [Candidatus Binatia bacterium]